MYNLRYHITSLVAIFLALTVGLLLGGVVVERGTLQGQKTTLVDSLKKSYEGLTADQRLLKAENEALAAFSDQAVPRVVSGALSGRTVVVMTDPASGDVVSEVTKAVREAGGRAAVVTFTSPGLGLSEPAVARAFASEVGSSGPAANETSVAPMLVAEWTTTGGTRPLTAALVKSGAARVEGLTSDMAVDGAVSAAAWETKPDEAALRLAKAITGPDRYGAGVETTKRAAGLAAAAVGVGLSAVDDVDRPIGRVSLVWILAGKTAGHYGLGKAADAAFPSPLFPIQ
jgi:hypothetical protein